MPFVQRSGNLIDVVKNTTQTITSETTLQNDDELIIRLNANKNYLINGFISTTTSSTPDFKATFGAITGASNEIFSLLDAVNAPSEAEAFGDVNILLVSGSSQGFDLAGFVTMGSAPGDLQFQWAQNTSSVQATSVNAGSWLRVIEVK